METFSALLAICAGNSPVPGEFPTQRPVTRSFDVYFDLCPNKWMSKQSWGWWFETLSCSLWRHRNGTLTQVFSNYWTGTVAITWLSQYQWSNHAKYVLMNYVKQLKAMKTTQTKQSTKKLCIFDGKYCTNMCAISVTILSMWLWDHIKYRAARYRSYSIMMSISNHRLSQWLCPCNVHSGHMVGPLFTERRVKYTINSLHRSGSTLTKVMALSLMAPSHYLKHCWLTSTWSSDIHLRAISQESPPPSTVKISLKITWIKLSFKSSRR